MNLILQKLESWEYPPADRQMDRQTSALWTVQHSVKMVHTLGTSINQVSLRNKHSTRQVQR